MTQGGTISTRRPHPAAMLLGASLTGLFLALLGPFGNYLNGGLATRALYWIAACWLGLVVYRFALRAGMRLTRDLPASPWPALAIAALAGSIVQAAATRIAAYALWPELEQVGPSPLLWYLQVLAIAAPLTLGYAWLTGYLAPAPRPEPRPGDPPLLARLPAHLGRTIVCLCMEDHYVRVHTRAGSVLLLMPLGQAIAEVAPLPGIKTHRSWWVAQGAVVRSEGSPRALRLHLANGLVAPVSRQAVAALRETGWLAASDAAIGPQ